MSNSRGDTAARARLAGAPDGSHEKSTGPLDQPIGRKRADRVGRGNVQAVGRSLDRSGLEAKRRDADQFAHHQDRGHEGQLPDLDRIRGLLSDIAGAGQRAGDIINSVRAMFKKDTNAKATINLNNLINTVLVLLRVDLQKDGVRVETRLDEGLPAVEGDAVQLQQVILNLIVNAADAMRAVQPRVLTVQTSRIAGRAHVSIEDTGPGISESDRDRIFNPLFTTKTGGMGMGLSICRSIIENHGGRIWVEAVEGPGAIFQFELPAAESRTLSRDLAA